ncbi:hypothetical protein jhhlp_001350 [Lomentospora prolificans]|uniref:ABM domain-containing protein n=1 Tax=Lomentospora prolificans TaxID=41688 RepID=A0A2N3NI03_9PEZI|nr:hypothetical protein jhhlp_001350 [Lomentospora prolificans]
MTVTEVGRMGVKPGFDVMNEVSPEGRVLSQTWRTVTTKPGGPYRVHWGLEIEDSSKIWAFMDWDCIEDHEKFANTVGSEAVKDLPTVLSHGEFTKHFDFEPFQHQEFQAPVTEMILAYFPADISPAQKRVHSARLREFVERGLNKCADVDSVSFGWGVEDDFPVIEGREGKGEGSCGAGWLAEYRGIYAV